MLDLTESSERPASIDYDPDPAPPSIRLEARLGAAGGSHRYRLRIFLAAADLVALVVAACLAALPLRIVVAFVASVFVLLLPQPSRLALRLSKDVPSVVGRTAVPVVAIQAVGGPRQGDVVEASVLAIAGLLIGRAAVYAAVRVWRRRGAVLERAVIVGAGPLGQQIGAQLIDHPEYGLWPIGVVDEPDGAVMALPLLGDLSCLDVVLRKLEVRHVIVAYGRHRDAEIAAALRRCASLRVEVHAVPRLYELGLALGDGGSDLWGLPVTRVDVGRITCRSWRCKRVFDIVASLALLTVVAPLLAVLAVAVKVSSRGPVLFRQRRVGLDGKEFEVLKLRSMRVNDDSDVQWSVVDDARLTPIGRFIRNTNLDELPQLLNVLKGEMSLVGPRPERPHFVAQFAEQVPEYPLRHRVPSGMTGLAQVHGLRGDTSIADRARFDNLYIDNWSFWWDIAILLATVKTFFPNTSR